MIPKKNSRRIVVDGVPYRWIYPRKPTAAQRLGGTVQIAVCAEEGGSTLLVDSHSVHTRNCVDRFGYSVTPAAVAQWIREARRDGWRAGTSGPQHRLSSSVDLERADIVGHPQLTSADAAALVDGPFAALSVLRSDGWWRPAIDGADLLELVAEAEAPHIRREREGAEGDGPEVPMSYGPSCALQPDTCLGQAPQHAFALDQNDPRRTKTTLFECSCGNLGCWPLIASIFAFESHVVWANFEPFHPSWMLRLGPFVFERRGYEAALFGQHTTQATSSMTVAPLPTR